MASSNPRHISRIDQEAKKRTVVTLGSFITENPPATPAPLLDFLSHPPPSDAQKLYIQGGDETDISAWKWRSKFYIRTPRPIVPGGSRWDGFIKNDEGLTVYVFSKMPTVLIAVDDNGAPHELRVSGGIPPR